MYTHIFIDVENVPAQQSIVFYYMACEQYDVNICDVVGDASHIPKIMLCMERPSFRIWNSMQGKNSADLWLATLMMKAIYEEKGLERIILLSNDRDYLPVVYLAKKFGMKICIALTTKYSEGMAKLLRKVALDSAVEIINMNRIPNVLPKDMKPKFSEDTYFPVCLMPFPLQYYYRDNWIGQTILAKKKGKYIELPFVDGLPDLYFMNLVQSTGIFKSNIDIYSATIDLGLNYDGERVWYMRGSKENGS